MRKTTIALLATMSLANSAVGQELVITGVIDGPLSGGVPKAVEVYVNVDVPDLSIFGIGGANNGGGSDGQEFTFPAVGASAGDFIYITSQAAGFSTFFGFAADYTSSAANINGDDAIELFKNTAVIDVFGDIDVDGSGEPWEYLDGWTYRVNGTGPDGSTFVLANWTFSGRNALDGETSNATAATPFPIGTFGEAGGGPSVLINEVDADTPGSDSLEFVELFDGGAGNTALDGLVAVFYNGNGDASYRSIDLDGFSTDADGYFVLGNAALDPAPGIVFPNNGLQNGADAVALYQGNDTDFPNGTALTTDNLVDAIAYDTNDSDDTGLLALLNAAQPQVNEGGAGNKDNHSNQRCANGSGGALNTDTYAQFLATPGEENVCMAPVELVFIHEIQGSGLVSPEVGNSFAIEGIVVADLQNGAFGTHGDLDGFYVQEEDADADADPMTSEGIFVYDGNSPLVDVVIGDLVRVEGAVSEFFGLTEITSFTGVEVLGSGEPLPTASAVTLPVTSVDDFEPVEAMRVTMPQALIISGYNDFEWRNEIELTSRRHLTPTAEFEPGTPDIGSSEQAFLLDRIVIDDGRTSSYPDPVIHPNGLEFDLGNLFRGGDSVMDVTGVLTFGFSEYRVHPTQGANYAPVNPRTAQPDAVGGNLKVASFNVLNYFTTLDQSPTRGTCGPSQSSSCRGADNATEFTRQRDKIIAAITALDADVVGLVEIENHPTDEAVVDLVAGLNAANGAGTYDYVATGPIGTDAIKVAFIYKPAAALLVGDYAVLDNSVDARFLDHRNRPTLAQSFIERSTGGVITVAVNHLKSKGSNCNSDGDPDMNDGAGNCNGTRAAAAAALVDWLASDPTGSGYDTHLIIGDLNSYDKEDPIDAIKGGGYSDLIFDFHGEDAYSYVFDARTGYLDYALASPGLLDAVTGVDEWHINADESDLLDYDTGRKKPAQDAIYAPDAYRSSDHDPVIVGLDVCDDIPPTFEDISVTPNVLWPANHKYVDIAAAVTVGDNGEAIPTVSLVSVTSNEPDNGAGDGNTVNDIVVVDDFKFQLRAERAGGGSGRIYSITYLATDTCGNSSTGTAMVSVPHSKKK